MKKNKKTFDIDKLKSELNSLRKNQLNLYFQKSTGQLEKTSEIKKTRRKIASLITDINQLKDQKNA